MRDLTHCQGDGCGETKIKARLLCARCYLRAKRRGDFGPLPENYYRKPTKPERLELRKLRADLLAAWAGDDDRLLDQIMAGMRGILDKLKR